MKSHTLMQAIARANRVYPNKPCGIIVDYVNVFKYMKRHFPIMPFPMMKLLCQRKMWMN